MAAPRVIPNPADEYAIPHWLLGDVSLRMAHEEARKGRGEVRWDDESGFAYWWPKRRSPRAE